VPEEGYVEEHDRTQISPAVVDDERMGCVIALARVFAFGLAFLVYPFYFIQTIVTRRKPDGTPRR
jgi:hypothetical protein